MENKIESEKDEGFLFEIHDNGYIGGLYYVTYTFIPIFMYGLLQIAGVINNTNSTLLTNTSFVISISVFVFLYFGFLIKKEISENRRGFKFYKSKIQKNYPNKVMNLTNIKEVRAVGFITVPSNKKNNEIGIIKKILASVMLLWPMLLGLIPYILIELFYFKRLFIKKTIMIKDNNDEVLFCMYPPPKETEKKELEKYFELYLNIDIQKVKTSEFISIV
ncbi:MAG: hypothetical protein RBT22_12015 [Aliarcobacter sp.]|nr:hypothetical protein [Aliarcobacter sp.]